MSHCEETLKEDIQHVCFVFLARLECNNDDNTNIYCCIIVVCDFMLNSVRMPSYTIADLGVALIQQFVKDF